MKKSKNYIIILLYFGVHARLILELKDKMVSQTDLCILYRGTEKLIEYNKMCIQSTPYFDRLDYVYVSMVSQEHSFCLAVEYLINLEVPKIAQYIRVIRVILVEVTRTLNYLLDVGAIITFLWCFVEREKLMQIYKVCIL